MTNAELIAVLRYCGNFEDREGCDEECPYFNDKDCPKRIMCDAADALEAAEKRIAELEEEHNKTVTAIFGEEQLWWENRCKELEAQIPKRGEWIHVEGDEPWEWRCTACYKIAEGHGDFRYCPNCGARMKGEQE